jgi:hypothetical protein
MTIFDDARRGLELEKRATPGPWKDWDSKAYAGDPDDGDAYVFVTDAEGCVTQICVYALDADAAFIAHARNTFPAMWKKLVEMEKALRKRVKYGHNDTCDSLLLYEKLYPCTCGHDDLVAALAPGMAQAGAEADEQEKVT